MLEETLRTVYIGARMLKEKDLIEIMQEHYGIALAFG